MFIAGIFYRGLTVIRFIPPTPKITADLYIQNVLEPLVQADFPRVYPGEERKVVLHQDSLPISITLSRQILLFWRYRVELMAEKKGFQMEQILK
ncbi:uncharacterized protein LOC129592524 [Paramacrobiotus metropolitanus]|uniref:uncharacterized protein LOC129592524 n=1 Tax=Paramacrobiotus metropolitanus TaxID=2943436 RepID=UPI0024461ABD|nr:uncharacterized protein LOC129592524 [Paramacrobiotus metropolitanus]